ncbi:MAG TPA: hypothetical protein VF094_06935 [Gaiellaceae bacterium]
MILILVGTLNIIEGISAISGANYLINQLLFSSLNAWGWFFLIWGIIQVLAGFAILGGATWAIFVGIATAFFNLISQFSWAHAYPVWAVSAMVADVLVIYGLLVYGGRRDSGY